MRIILMIILLPIQFVYAQEVDRLEAYMSEIRKGSFNAVPVDIIQSENPKAILAALENFEKDSVTTIRARAYSIAKRIGQHNENKEIRQTAISHLIRGISDTDSGISGISNRGLTNFYFTDFNDQHKSQIISFLEPQQSHLNQIVLLVGFLQIREAMPRLDQLHEQISGSRLQWSVRLAKARMGDEQNIQFITERLTQASVYDDFVYEVVPDLIYTRQPEIFEYLEQIILSNEQNCSSANPDAETNILCGYRVMEYLAPVIEDFPLPTDEYGELMVDDYPEALEELRNWLVDQDYAIDTDSF